MHELLVQWTGYVVPTWNSLAILGGIVVIRTVIVYFLNLEPSRGAKQGNA
ncbi:MAG: DUF1622 domain-containing protein [Sulfuricella sp.]